MSRLINAYTDLALDLKELNLADSLLALNLETPSINNLFDDHQQRMYGMSDIESFYRVGKLFYSKYQNDNDLLNLIKSKKALEQALSLVYNKKRLRFQVNDEIVKNHHYFKVASHCIKTTYFLYNKTNETSYVKDAFIMYEHIKGDNIHYAKWNSSAIKFGEIQDSIRIQDALISRQINYLQSKLVSSKIKFSHKEIMNLQNKLISLKDKYDSLITHLEQNYPEYYNLKYNFNVLSIEEVQQKLKSNEALIEYFNGEDQTYVFTITKYTASFQSIPLVDNKEIEEFRKALTPNFEQKNPSQAYRDYTNLAYELFKKILATPLKNIDTTKVNTLRIIPDGLLGLVPFETLITQPVNTKVDDYGNLPYLFKKYNISYGYSATSMFMFKDQNRKMSASQVLAFAPSEATSSPSAKIASLAPLKWNLQEVLNLNNYFNHYTSTGDKATEAAFKEKIKDYPIAHLAMHAIIDDEDPMYSKLLFAPSKDTLEDGMLHTFELYNMRLNTLMVVLSACNTGSGKLQKGEGVMSLARAFAYAGSPSVVMSHWAVDDKSTAELMKYFYKHLSKGESKDAALRLAKLDFLKNSSPIYHHPYYWNNFVVMGDPVPVVDAPYWWKVITFLFIITFFAIILGISDRHKILKR
ncbi:CHAT domain-containing protein [Fulvivirga ulvae]|uniref:CHAT domain-containing protein n=1 Tax=Fulvivirga ulvae TaxID=2904245 RepID=UPI001F25A8F2|nr:CHAT domain-containing protein [Fulvivirga ulvae]UII34860.1 CHAT domain-containing protein [Fulvivirga ulvae]